jgi:hypothetical protein
MLFALFRACMANIRTNTAKLLAEASAHAHHLGSGVTDGGTFQVQLDAGPEGIYLLFVQAGHSTMVAGCSTCLAGFNTLLILLIRHTDLFYRLNNNKSPFTSFRKHHTCRWRREDLTMIILRIVKKCLF